MDGGVGNTMVIKSARLRTVALFLLCACVFIVVTSRSSSTLNTTTDHFWFFNLTREQYGALEQSFARHKSILRSPSNLEKVSETDRMIAAHLLPCNCSHELQQLQLPLPGFFRLSSDPVFTADVREILAAGHPPQNPFLVNPNCSNYRTRVPSNRPHYLTAVLVFKLVAVVQLVTWLEYYLLLGVEHFYLYSNDCNDEMSLPYLHGYIATGQVTYCCWCYKPPQMSAYEHARHTYNSTWMMFFDADEYLVLKGQPVKRPLVDFLRHKEDFPCIRFNWQSFSASGHWTHAPGSLVANYRWRFVRTNAHNLHTKVIMQPKSQLTFFTMHTMRHPASKRAACYSETGHRTPNSPFSPVSVNVSQLNHYYTRSVAEYFTRNIRGRGGSNQSVFRVSIEYGEEYDASCILHLLALLRHRRHASCKTRCLLLT